MKKPYTKQDETWVMDTITILKELLYLVGWEIGIEFHLQDHEGNPMVGATMKLDWEYRRGGLDIYPCFWKKDKTTRKDCLLHEFLHIPTLMLTKQAYALLDGDLVTKKEIHNTNEHVTTWLESIITRDNSFWVKH